MSVGDPSRIAIVLVVAVAENGVIGRDNALPWRLSSDLKRFKALTIGKPVVMGRRTFLSIGRPLPGRTNIVVSRSAAFTAPGVVVAGSLDAALAVAHGDALRRGVSEIAVIGGTDIFTQAMPLAERLEITHVHARPEGDTCFPAVDTNVWRATARQSYPAGPRDDASFETVTYVRPEPNDGRESPGDTARCAARCVRVVSQGWLPYNPAQQTTHCRPVRRPPRRD